MSETGHENLLILLTEVKEENGKMVKLAISR